MPADRYSCADSAALAAEDTIGLALIVAFSAVSTSPDTAVRSIGPERRFHRLIWLNRPPCAASYICLSVPKDLGAEQAWAERT